MFFDRFLCKRKIKQFDTYLIYGINDLDLSIDNTRYSYFIAEKSISGKWNSHCGNNIVNVTYVEKLF